MFKDRIKELCVNNDLSLAQFAEVVGISRATVSLYEAGKQNPSRKTVAKICEAFGVNEEWLLGEDEVTAVTEKAAKKPSKKKKKSKAAKASVSKEDEPAAADELPEEAEEAEEVESEPEPEEIEEVVETEETAEPEETEETSEAEEIVETEETSEAEVFAEAAAEEPPVQETEDPETREDPKPRKDPKPKKDPKPTKKRNAAGTKPAGRKKTKKPSKETTASNMKGESKMSKKTTNRLVPPIPFPPYGKAASKGEEQGSDKKAKANELKEKYKVLLKKYREENVDARKTASKNRKDKRDKAFERFMEMQETFADFISEDALVLPFVPMYSIFPKKMMKRFMEFERMTNEYFIEQAESYEDFCKQRRKMLRDMVKASVIKNEETEEKDEEAGKG